MMTFLHTLLIGRFDIMLGSSVELFFMHTVHNRLVEIGNGWSCLTFRSSSLDFGGANAAGFDASVGAFRLRRPDLESLCTHDMYI
jgi:hypothetical protein